MAHMAGINPTQMTVPELAGACRAETDRYRRGEPSLDAYCFELLRRALCDRDDAAWASLVDQYRGSVVSWLRRHPVAAELRENDDLLVNRAFERFWRAIDRERFGLFRDVPALMKYLKMCVHSVLLDEARARRAQGAAESLDRVLLGDAAHAQDARPTAASASGSVDVETVAVGRMAGHELWAAVARALPDEAERLVAYLSFVRDLKPAEIHARHPDHYPQVADVYRVKRNVIERLRRSPELQAWLT